MSQKYAQLTEHKRYQIYILKKAEHTQAYIVKMVGVSASTISRELKRNTGQRGYRPKQAQMKAIQRRQSARKYIKQFAIEWWDWNACGCWTDGLGFTEVAEGGAVG